MGFSLGGLLRSGVGILAHSNPLTGALFDAATTLAQRRAASGGSGPADQLLLPAKVSGGTMGGSAPQLPAIPGVTGRTPTTGVQIVRSQKGAVPSRFSIVPGATTHGHYKKDGSWSMRRRPRMNPANGSAIRRAARRIKAAEKLFRRVLSISHPGHAHGHIKPKFGRKR